MSQLHLDKFNSRPLSWSSISSFEYDPEQWAQKYLEGKETPPSAEMLFGSATGRKIEKDPNYLPTIPRHNKMEHEFKVNLDGIILLGYADSFCTKTNKKLLEYKTSRPGWDKKKVDSHRQLTMYVLCNFITNKIKPEDVDIRLVWMPTKKEENGNFEVTISFVEPIEENIKIFKTKRTMTDILKFASYIKQIHAKMSKCALEYNPEVF